VTKKFKKTPCPPVSPEAQVFLQKDVGDFLWYFYDGWKTKPGGISWAVDS
jgi:hypothetical protein